MHKYGGWIIVIGGFFLAACLLAAFVFALFTASAANTAGSAVDDALRSAASEDLSVAGTQRNTTVVMGMVNIGSGNTEQSSVATTVQHKTTSNSDYLDNPWTVILVISLIVLIAVVVAVFTFGAQPEYPS